MFLYVGILRFFGQQDQRRRLVSLYAVFVAGLSYFLYVHDEFATRGALLSAALATMAFVSGRALLVNKTRSVAASANLLAAVFIAHGCFFTYRLVVQLAGARISNFFDPTPFNGTAFLDAIIAGNAWTFGLVLMISQRLNGEMKDAKEEMDLVFNTSPDAVLISRLSDGLIVNVNDGFVALSGFTHAECLGTSTQALKIWKNPAHREAVVDDLRSKGRCRNYEAVFQRKDGSELFGAMSAVVFNLQDIPHVISVTRDITERKQAEEALRTSERSYRLLFDANPHSMWIYDLETLRFLAVNASAVTHYGYTRDEFLQMTLNDIRPAEDVAHLLDNVACSTDDVQESGIWRHRRKNGEIISVEIASHFVTWLGRSAPVVLAHDVTARERTRQELQSSEERFRRAVVDSPFPILLHAEDGAVLMASQSWCDITGYTREELQTIGDWTERAYGERQPLVQAEIDVLYGLDHRKHEGDYTIRTKTGSLRIWEFSSAPLGRLPDGRRLVISMAMDVTERRAADAEVRQALAKVEASRKALVSVVEDQKRAEVKVAANLNELRRWHEATLGREGRVLEVKREVNELLAQAGQPPRYPSAEAGGRSATMGSPGE